MSERWKPEVCESYYYIDSICCVDEEKWHDIILDKIRHKKGNCFKTFSEAQSAAEKVKALLLSLHEEQPVAECNQLPKLTAEVFDRPDCPAWAKYAMVNDLGDGCWYEENPGLFYTGRGHGTKIMFIDRFDASDWENSLIERPKKNALPKWCKVGKWVYLCNGKYYRIESINECQVDLSEGISVGRNDIHSEMVSARIRPWTFEEAPFMIKCKKNASRDQFTVATLSYDGTFYTMPNCCLNSISLYDISQHYTQSNGSPCGILQHLENGEWIE